jgi:hypothetical protein
VFDELFCFGVFGRVGKIRFDAIIQNHSFADIDDFIIFVFPDIDARQLR